MVKATLRTAKPAATVSVSPSPAVQATVVHPPGQAAAPATPLEDLVAPTETAVAVVETSDTAVAPREQAYTSRTNLHGDGIEGDWGSDDVKLPQFKIVQGSGPLSQIFANGEIIFNDEGLLPPPSIKPDAKNPSIRIIPISLKRQWVEKLTQEQNDAGEVPRFAYTLQEVHDNGGTTRWVGKEQPENFWQDAARQIILIEKPESSEHAGFALEFGGKQYAVAVWYVSGGAYRASAKVIIGASQSSLLVPVLDAAGQPTKSPTGQVIKRPLLWKNFWSLNFVRKAVGPKSFMVWYPVVKLTPEATSTEIRDYCAGIAGNNATQTAAVVEE